MVLSRPPRASARTKCLAALCVAVGLASGCRPPSPTTPAASAPPPRLLITIVVDQLPAWLAETRWPALPADGGIARLRREGLTVRELRYAHAVTDTAPGHAALYTGATPRETGIFANEVLGDDGKPRSILLDETTHVVDVGAEAGPRPGSSLARLRLPTLADALVAAAPDARVYSFSLKDRGALFGAGRHPTAALWLDVAGDAFATSTAFPAAPAWARPLCDRAAVAAARAAGWTLSADDVAWVAAHAETPDDQAGEGDLAGLGRVFPHVVGSTKAMRATPLGDRVLFALAGAALEKIGAARDAAPALLALSLSSHDYIAHVFGPHSWEAWAADLELDRALAELLAQADRAVGPDGYAVMLTSDHGGAWLPEVAPATAGLHCPDSNTSSKVRGDHAQRSCAPRRRVSPPEVVGTLEAALGAELGTGPWIAGFAEPLIYLTPRGRGLSGGARDTMLAAAAAALKPLGVAQIVDTRAPRRWPCPSAEADDESHDAYLCEAIDPSGPGDLYLEVFEGNFFEADLVPGFGMSHGTPYLYDRAVPLLVRAPGRVPQGATRDAPVSFRAFSRTAASLLGVPPLSNLAGAETLVR
ncbi:MAG: Alkaline phosphatase [Myxococcales bacterium]|nr:Alkaline phosphatase [Myxococcales bacterium]